MVVTTLRELDRIFFDHFATHYNQLQTDGKYSNFIRQKNLRDTYSVYKQISSKDETNKISQTKEKGCGPLYPPPLPNLPLI